MISEQFDDEVSEEQKSNQQSQNEEDFEFTEERNIEIQRPPR